MAAQSDLELELSPEDKAKIEKLLGSIDGKRTKKRFEEQRNATRVSGSADRHGTALWRHPTRKASASARKKAVNKKRGEGGNQRAYKTVTHAGAGHNIIRWHRACASLPGWAARKNWT
jgi:hypothetical protein